MNFTESEIEVLRDQLTVAYKAGLQGGLHNVGHYNICFDPHAKTIETYYCAGEYYHDGELLVMSMRGDGHELDVCEEDMCDECKRRSREQDYYSACPECQQLADDYWIDTEMELFEDDIDGMLQTIIDWFEVRNLSPSDKAQE